MTCYLNFRSGAVDGTVVDPYLLQGDGTVDPPALRAVSWIEIAPLVAGRNLLFGVHGFNVNYANGARSLAQLEPRLGLGAADLFIGVLWPGDAWIPVINYPFEPADAMHCGRLLAAFCERWLAGAQSFSFLSHSLGALLVLEAVRNLSRPARTVCLAAAAVDRDSLSAAYAAATANAGAISLLASHEDMVLKLAFRLGDPISELLRDQSIDLQAALGYAGPAAPVPATVRTPWQIADADNYGHGNYLPPGDHVQTPAQAQADKWPRPAEFMARAFRGLPQLWP